MPERMSELGESLAPSLRHFLASKELVPFTRGALLEVDPLSPLVRKPVYDLSARLQMDATRALPFFENTGFENTGSDSSRSGSTEATGNLSEGRTKP